MAASKGLPLQMLSKSLPLRRPFHKQSLSFTCNVSKCLLPQVSENTNKHTKSVMRSTCSQVQEGPHTLNVSKILMGTETCAQEGLFLVSLHAKACPWAVLPML